MTEMGGLGPHIVVIVFPVRQDGPGMAHRQNSAALGSSCPATRRPRPVSENAVPGPFSCRLLARTSPQSRWSTPSLRRTSSRRKHLRSRRHPWMPQRSQGRRICVRI